MKKVFTIVFLATIIFAFSAKAQVKSYIAISGGMSNPLGSYGSTDYSNNQAGFAKRGITFALDGAYYIKKNFGIGATISFQDQGKLNSNDAVLLAQGYTNTYTADQTTLNAFDRFHNFNILIGPQYSFTYHDFILDLRASAGITVVTSTPETNIKLVGVPEQTNIFYQYRSHGTEFAYGGSAGLRYKLSDGLSLGIRSGYVASQGAPVTNSKRDETLGRDVTRIPIKELQTTIGLYINL
ncbi:MAG: outer membrane beta-barrel protein [Sphingobacteriales bacterium]